MPWGVRKDEVFSSIAPGRQGDPVTSLVTSPQGHGSARWFGETSPDHRVGRGSGWWHPQPAQRGKHPKTLTGKPKQQKDNCQPRNRPRSGISAGFSLQAFPNPG